MTLANKIEDARALISAVLARARNPAIMSSFGKDSMVVLHLVRSVKAGLPVIFHREPFMPHKYAFANGVIAKWGLTVYDFPPAGTAVQEKDGCVEVVNYYPAGARPCVLPTGICEPEQGETALCALHDLYLKPTGTFAYPWDVVFHGHKSSDRDPIYGDVPLNSDFASNLDSASAAFPIRNFTDADVWEYHRMFSLPMHETRYADGAELADKTNNPDYFPACTACMKQGGSSVPCPRLGGITVSNVSSQLRWAAREKLAYITPSAAA